MITPMIEFINPGRLWWLLAPAVLVLLYLLLCLRNRNASAPNSRLLRVLPSDRPWKRHLAVGLAALAICSLVIAHARPKDYAEVPRDRATVVVAIDVSRSMVAEDVKPNRLKAAQDAAKQFLGMLPPRFNVALVAFAGTSRLVTPPTTDRASVAGAIDDLEVAPSTAIGDGIYSSLNALKLVPPDPKHPNDPAPGVIVLLSDGATNIGRPSARAAEEAKKQKVPIYTIAYGTARGTVTENGVRQPVPVDHRELAQVSRISGGEKLAAASDQELRDAYESIAKSIGYQKEFVEVTEKYVGYSVLFSVLAVLAVMSLAARWP